MRHTCSTSYITPIKSDGVVQEQSAVDFGRGSFTLVAGATYFYPLGGQDAPYLDAHCQWDAALILTSVTVETCGFPESEVSYYSDDAGEWIDQDPATAYVGSDGAGVTVTAGVVAVAGGAQGGCNFQMSGSTSRRTRLKVVVGAIGGEMRTASWGKE